MAPRVKRVTLDLNSSLVFTFLGGFENVKTFSEKKGKNSRKNFVLSWSGLFESSHLRTRLGYKNRLWRTLVQNRYFKLQCPGGRKKIFSFANGNTVDFFLILPPISVVFREKGGQKRPFFFLCFLKADRNVFGRTENQKSVFFKGLILGEIGFLLFFRFFYKPVFLGAV